MLAWSAERTRIVRNAPTHPYLGTMPSVPVLSGTPFSVNTVPDRSTDIVDSERSAEQVMERHLASKMRRFHVADLCNSGP